MKVLLDENLPHRLRHEIIGHDCYTVTYMGFSALENGQLLGRAAAEGFDVLLTKDANLRYQQNLIHLPLAVIVIHAASNHIDDVRPLLPSIHATLKALVPRSIVHVGNKP